MDGWKKSSMVGEKGRSESRKMEGGTDTQALADSIPITIRHESTTWLADVRPYESWLNTR